MGRPSEFNQEIAAKICERLAAGESLRAVCRDDDMPDRETIRRWRDANEEFRGQYARAREDGLHEMADEIIEISDDASGDSQQVEITPGVVGQTPLDTEFVQRSKLRVETRKWLLTKLLPKVFGEQSKVELTGADGGPVQLNDPSTAAKLAAIIEAARHARDHDPAGMA